METKLLIPKQSRTWIYLIEELIIPFLLQVASNAQYFKDFSTWVIHSLLFLYERNVRTVPLIIPLQIGHFLREGAHPWHTTRWPQGMNTIETSLSIHTLQVRSSCNLLNCSSSDRPNNKKNFNKIQFPVYLPVIKDFKLVSSLKFYFTWSIFCWNILHVLFHWVKKT